MLSCLAAARLHAAPANWPRLGRRGRPLPTALRRPAWLRLAGPPRPASRRPVQWRSTPRRSRRDPARPRDGSCQHDNGLLITSLATCPTRTLLRRLCRGSPGAGGAASELLNARLVLILANHVGDPQILARRCGWRARHCRPRMGSGQRTNSRMEEAHMNARTGHRGTGRWLHAGASAALALLTRHRSSTGAPARRAHRRRRCGDRGNSQGRGQNGMPRASR